MRAVWSWLLDLVELPDDIGPDEGARALTGAGLEVEEVEVRGDEFSGVVIAEVVGKTPHPDADRLTLVDVIDRDGGRATEVVCGAPNVPEPGGRVLWAKPGAVLPGNFEIAPKTIKGVESAGMLCAEDELGLGDDHDGIIVLGTDERDAPLGAMAQDALGLRDIVFDIGVPANRPDANGHLGLARELAALCGGRLRTIDPDLTGVTDASLSAEALVSVALEDPERCTRYTARVLDGLTVRPSPRWLRRRLEAVGVRPLSNLVDVTNYVMFELGQPLHAFDFGLVQDGKIIVRRARAGEKLTTLDDIERSLVPDDLLICDPRGAVAVAGVMGGAGTEIQPGTTRVLLESAHFEPTGVRRTGRRLNLHSESSHRFERGVDPNGALRASARAARLLAELGGGTVAAGAVDAYPTRAATTSVSIRPVRASALTGVELAADDVRTALESIELAVAADQGDALAVEVPTFRPDLTREVDLIEEVIRLRGFDKVPATLPRNDIAPSRQLDTRAELARSALTAAGLREAVTYAFTSPDKTAAMRFDADDARSTPIPIKNPLRGDHSVMRTSLLPNLLGIVARNVAHGNRDIRVFEVGTTFLTNPSAKLPHERRCAAGVITGARAGWLGDGGDADFFDAKGAAEQLLEGVLGNRAGEVRFAAIGTAGAFHPGVAASIALGDIGPLGVVGEIHPKVRAAFDIDPAVFGFELDLERLPGAGPTQMRSIPRYPAITRDISVFVDASVPASRVRELVAASDEALLDRVIVLEDFRDPKYVPDGKKGMLWSVTYRSGERTLTDAEVDAAHEAIVARLLSELPAERR